MKKIYSLIAMAAFALAANAEITSDVSAYHNYIYPDAEASDLTAGQAEQDIAIALKSEGAVTSLGFTITLPEGFVITDFWSDNTLSPGSAKKGYKITCTDATILDDGRTVRAGTFNTGAEPYTGDGVVFFLTCTIPADAPAVAPVEIVKGECSLTPAYIAENSWVTAENPSCNYENCVVSGTVNIKGGADAIDNVAADGTQTASAAKKVVDGKLVIETAKGSFNAAGAQVK